jgi:hypothetical protein
MTRAPRVFDPSLQAGKLDLQLRKLLLEFLAAHLTGRGGRLGCLVLLLIVFRHLAMLPGHYRDDSLGTDQ